MQTAIASRVLIADDVADLRALVRTLLEFDGFEVVGEVVDRSQIADGVASLEPDLLLLDLTMGDGDTLELIAELREHHPDLLIVVLSGFVASDLVEATADQGADAYIEKVSLGSTLVPRLRAVIDASGRVAP